MAATTLDLRGDAVQSTAPAARRLCGAVLCGAVRRLGEQGLGWSRSRAGQGWRTAASCGLAYLPTLQALRPDAAAGDNV